MFQLERMVMFYLPRICNHCINPACVAACPSGAIYKRGEDGIVLINQERCRAWRMCITACPYKKSISTGIPANRKSAFYAIRGWKPDRHLLVCTPCVGRIRYLGVMLYDADRIHEMASCDEKDLIKKQLDIYLDPNDPKVIAEAKKCGIPDSTIQAAQKSPVWKYVKEWGWHFRSIPSSELCQACFM